MTESILPADLMAECETAAKAVASAQQQIAEAEQQLKAAEQQKRAADDAFQNAFGYLNGTTRIALLSQGKRPEDFDIRVDRGALSIAPKATMQPVEVLPMNRAQRRQTAKRIARGDLKVVESPAEPERQPHVREAAPAQAKR